MAQSPFFTAFPVLEFPLSFEEWDRLPRNPAYKYEYFDGRAVLSPRPWTRSAVLELDSWQPVRLRRAPTLRPLVPGDWDRLPDLFASAFLRELPFSVLPEAGARDLAERVLDFTRMGGDGEVLVEACIVAEDEEGPTGAALVTLVPPRQVDLEGESPGLLPHLTWIFVSAWEKRRGCGTALLGAVIERLRADGYRRLVSTFLVGSSSALWHWQNGFRMLPTRMSGLWRVDEGS